MCLLLLLNLFLLSLSLFIKCVVLSSLIALVVVFFCFSLFWFCLVADLLKSTWLLLAQFVLLFSCVHRFSSILFFLPLFLFFYSRFLSVSFYIWFFFFFLATQIFISLWILLLLQLFRFFSSLFCFVIYLAVARENVVKKLSENFAEHKPIEQKPLEQINVCTVFRQANLFTMHSMSFCL